MSDAEATDENEYTPNPERDAAFARMTDALDAMRTANDGRFTIRRSRTTEDGSTVYAAKLAYSVLPAHVAEAVRKYLTTARDDGHMLGEVQVMPAVMNEIDSGLENEDDLFHMIAQRMAVDLVDVSGGETFEFV